MSIVKNKQVGTWALSNFHSIDDIFQQTYIKIDGRNSIEVIVDDFNVFHKTNFDLNWIKKSFDNFPTQQSFFSDVETFDKIMSFIVYIIENRSLTTWNSYKIPATLLERYFGVSILLNSFRGSINLSHRNSMEWREGRYLSYKIIHFYHLIYFWLKKWGKR